jgi:hypothetical protein
VTSTRQRLTGRMTVALPPAEAFRLFTPRGEQAWAPGWHPRFPAPAPDDTEPGTVFETGAHGQHTIWVVTGQEPGRRLCYARVTPGGQAGTVTVTITAAGGHSEVEVTYQLTALTPAADHKLRDFADRYPAYLQEWQHAITTWLHHRHPPASRLHPGHSPARLTAVASSTDSNPEDEYADDEYADYDAEDREQPETSAEIPDDEPVDDVLEQRQEIPYSNDDW